MSKFEQNMREIFDTDIPKEIEVNKDFYSPVPMEKPINVENNLSSDLSDAYQQSRENLQDLLDQGKEAMDQLLEIAKEGQHPRAYEVYGTLLKNMVDANKELLNIQKQMRDMDRSQKKDSMGTTIDKAIFVGSTSELSKFLKENN